MEKLVSIIMPTYNCGKYIKETIFSVLGQTYKNWELIVVDDNSQDNTEKIVKDIIKKDKRIRYCKLEKNSGAAVARTKAMEIARGNYIAFLDSDDLWNNKKLEIQLDYMEKNNYNFMCTSYEQIDENSDKILKIVRAKKRTSYNRLLLDCPVGNSTVMYNVDKMGKFKVPNIRKRNDDALWLKMLKKEKYIYGLDEILTKYRVRDGSISSKKIDLVKYHWELYRKIEKLSFFRSVFHIGYWGIIKTLKIK